MLCVILFENSMRFFRLWRNPTKIQDNSVLSVFNIFFLLLQHTSNFRSVLWTRIQKIRIRTREKKTPIRIQTKGPGSGTTFFYTLSVFTLFLFLWRSECRVVWECSWGKTWWFLSQDSERVTITASPSSFTLM